MGSNRTWIASAGATAALVVAAGLYVQALEPGHSDGGLRSDPVRVKSAATERTCVGTRPVGSLPGRDDDTRPGEAISPERHGAVGEIDPGRRRLREPARQRRPTRGRPGENRDERAREREKSPAHGQHR